MTRLYTIGYEQTDIDNVVAVLKAFEIKVLADVRAVAASRKKGFSKSALRNRLEAENIKYMHLVELGDPKPGREAARAQHYERFRMIYHEHLEQPGPQAALRILFEVARNNPTCLLCFEYRPEHCHRSIVADRLQESGVEEICNLFGNNPDNPERHAALFSRNNSGQSASAAE